MDRMFRCAMVCLLLAGVALGMAGCIVTEGTAPPEWMASSENASDTGDAAQDSPPAPEGSHGHGSEVLMMGRSVMAGWFDHWEYDGNSPVLRDGYALYYREVAGPPDIGSDAAAAIAETPEGTIVFFKLCFVDFWASNDADVQANVDECIGYVNQVRAACEGRNITLVVGNALPQHLAATTPALVKTHLGYNAALEQLDAEDDQMVVFDVYSLLADHNGAVYRGLALSSDDSHLNDVAYQVLDEEFFALLDGLDK